MKQKLTAKQKLTNEYNFNTYVLEGIQMVYPMKYDKRHGLYTITTSQYGKLDMYPKADKVMIRCSGKWINCGAEWLCNNL